MSFLNNLKEIAGKASEEYNKAAEEARAKFDGESSEASSELMSKMKSIASKANEEYKYSPRQLLKTIVKPNIRLIRE